MAETLPWSPHWEFGISHWQLETKLHYLSGKRKDRRRLVGRDPPCLIAGEEVRDRATAGLLLEIDVGQRLPRRGP